MRRPSARFAAKRGVKPGSTSTACASRRARARLALGDRPEREPPTIVDVKLEEPKAPPAPTMRREEPAQRPDPPRPR